MESVRLLHASVRCMMALAVSMFLWNSAAQAQFLMMPDSATAANRLVLFDPFDGSLVNPNYFGLALGTPVHAIQVPNGEIWVSEQVGDRISRWDLAGNFLGAIGGGTTGGMDNVRGMGRVGNTVYLTNTGTGNGAPGRAVHRIDATTATVIDFFSTPASAGFHVLPHQGELLVSSDSANDDVHRYSVAGTSLGTFHNSTSLNFAEQMDHAINGDVLVAGFSSNNVVRLDPTTGALLSSFSASGARGLWQLGNGNIMWTNSAGAHVFDVNTNTSTLVYSGQGRFLDFVVIPEPGSGLLVVGALSLLTLARRRTAPFRREPS